MHCHNEWKKSWINDVRTYKNFISNNSDGKSNTVGESYLISYINFIHKNLGTPLFKNSLYLMLTTLFSSGSGFIFWFFAAKYYSPENVGVAVTIISAMGLLSLFTRLGLDTGIIKYLSKENDKNEMINSCLSIVSLASLTISIIFLIGIDTFSPALHFMWINPSYLILFVVFTVANSVFILQSGVFAALRNTKYTLIQNLIAMSRFLILPAFFTLGVFGIFFAYGAGIFVACVMGYSFLIKAYAPYRLSFVCEKNIFIKMFRFSFANYIASIFEMSLNFLLPLIIINVLNSESTAYFYIAWSFSGILLMFPRATSISLFAEGAHSTKHFRNKVIKSVVFVYLALIPLIIGVFWGGENILSIFGPEYSKNAFDLLKILALTCVPFTINIFYVTIKRVGNQISNVVYVYAFISIFTIAVSCVLIPLKGIVGVGIAWLLANIIVSIIIVLSFLAKPKMLCE